MTGGIECITRDAHLYVQVRNERGRELLDSISGRLEKSPTMSTGDRRQLVLQTALADDTAKLGEAPDPMPLWLGNILAWVVEKVRIVHLILHHAGNWFTDTAIGSWPPRIWHHRCVLT